MEKVFEIGEMGDLTPKPSYREVGLRLSINKNTVLAIVKRHRAEQAGP